MHVGTYLTYLENMLRTAAAESFGRMGCSGCLHTVGMGMSKRCGNSGDIALIHARIVLVPTQHKTHNTTTHSLAVACFFTEKAAAFTISSAAMAKGTGA